MKSLCAKFVTFFFSLYVLHFFFPLLFVTFFSSLCVSHFLFLYCAFCTFFFLIVHLALSFSPLCILCFLFPPLCVWRFLFPPLCVWRFLFPHCVFGAFFFPIVHLVLTRVWFFVWTSIPFFFPPHSSCSLIGCYLFIYLFISSLCWVSCLISCFKVFFTYLQWGEGGGGSSNGVNPLRWARKQA